MGGGSSVACGSEYGARPGSPASGDAAVSAGSAYDVRFDNFERGGMYVAAKKEEKEGQSENEGPRKDKGKSERTG